MAKKSIVLALRVTPEFRESLEDLAARNNVTMSEAIRLIVEGQAAHSSDIREGYALLRDNLKLMRAVLAGKSDKMPDDLFKDELRNMRRIVELYEKRSSRVLTEGKGKK